MTHPDQYHAAQRHAEHVVARAVSTLEYVTSAVIPASQLRERIIAAAIQDLPACRHLTDTGPQPAYAILEHHTIVCGSCLAHIPDPGPSPVCHWCDDQPATTILVVNYAHAIIIGAACDECDRHLA